MARAGFTAAEVPWALRATFVGGAAVACIAAGAVRKDDALLFVGLGLLLVAYFLGAVMEATADRGEPEPSPRARLLAGILAFAAVAVLAAALSAFVAIFLGVGAFRWMAVCLPLAAAWLLLSGAARRLARRLARGQSPSRANSTS